MKGLTIQLIPYHEIENLTSLGKIRKLLNVAKQNKIVLLQGRLTAEEERELIKTTMEEINKEFKGIELATLDNQDKSGRIKKFFTNLLIGNKQGLTIIGPASIVKEIKKDPSKIELLTEVKKK